MDQKYSLEKNVLAAVLRVVIIIIIIQGWKKFGPLSHLGGTRQDFQVAKLEP